MAAIFQDGGHLQALWYIYVPLWIIPIVIKAPKLACTLIWGCYFIKERLPRKNPKWRPFSKMAAIRGLFSMYIYARVVRSHCHTSTKIGMLITFGLIFHKKTLAT